LAASTDVYVDEDGHLRARPPRGLTANQAGTWKRIVPPDDVKRDLARERLDRAIYDDARSRLSAAVGKSSPKLKRRRTNGRKSRY
jgi:hypothetical protein